jgi:hypothetical protein
MNRSPTTSRSLAVPSAAALAQLVRRRPGENAGIQAGEGEFDDADLE